MKREIRALTGLRGVAAMLVVVFHYTRLPDSHLQPNTFVWHGYLWVDMFFVLSGFVMAETYSKLFSDGFAYKNYGSSGVSGW